MRPTCVGTLTQSTTEKVNPTGKEEHTPVSKQRSDKPPTKKGKEKDTTKHPHVINAMVNSM